MHLSHGVLLCCLIVGANGEGLGALLQRLGFGTTTTEAPEVDQGLRLDHLLQMTCLRQPNHILCSPAAGRNTNPTPAPPIAFEDIHLQTGDRIERLVPRRVAQFSDYDSIYSVSPSELSSVSSYSSSRSAEESDDRRQSAFVQLPSTNLEEIDVISDDQIIAQIESLADFHSFPALNANVEDADYYDELLLTPRADAAEYQEPLRPEERDASILYGDDLVDFGLLQPTNPLDYRAPATDTTSKATTAGGSIGEAAVDVAAYCAKYLRHYDHYCANASAAGPLLQLQLQTYCPIYREKCQPELAQPAFVTEPAAAAAVALEPCTVDCTADHCTQQCICLHYRSHVARECAGVRVQDAVRPVSNCEVWLVACEPFWAPPPTTTSTTTTTTARPATFTNAKFNLLDILAVGACRRKNSQTGCTAKPTRCVVLFMIFSQPP